MPWSTKASTGEVLEKAVPDSMKLRDYLCGGVRRCARLDARGEEAQKERRKSSKLKEPAQPADRREDEDRETKGDERTKGVRHRQVQTK